MRTGLNAFALLCGLAEGRPLRTEQQQDLAALASLAPEPVVNHAKQQLLDALGPAAISSDTVAVRLPTAAYSKAWNVDQVKAVSGGMVANRDFSVTRFLVGGAGEQEGAHALMGAAVEGKDKKHQKQTSSYFLAATHVDKNKGEFVAAVPEKAKSSGGQSDSSLAWGSIKINWPQLGHVTKEQVQQAWAMAQGKSSQRAQQGTVEVKEQAAPAATVKETEAGRAKQEAAQKAEEKAEPAAAGEAKEALTQEEREQKAAEEDFVWHQAQLVVLKFPPLSAKWFAMFRAWCLDKKHALTLQEESERLPLLEGSWRVAVDSENPAGVGKILVIKDSKIHAPFGSGTPEVFFHAYKESRFAAVMPLDFPLTNSTVDLYRMCKINGTRIEWDGGNLWERVPSEAAAQPAAKASPAAGASSTKALGAAEKAAAPAQLAAYAAEWLKALGQGAAGAAGAEKQKPMEATMWDAFTRLGNILMKKET